MWRIKSHWHSRGRCLQDSNKKYRQYPCHSPQEKRWFTVHITCFDDGGKKMGHPLAHENITTRMIAEMALKESTAQLQTLLFGRP